MGPDVYVPLLSAFIGALVGSAGSVAVVLIQSFKDDRRHRREIATQLALAEQALHAEYVKHSGGSLFPPLLYLSHYNQAMEALSKGPLSPDQIIQFASDTEKLVAALQEVENHRRKRDK